MRIELLGTSFSIQSDEDPAYLLEIVQYLSQKIAEVSASVKTDDQVKIGILAALLISDELFKLRANHQAKPDQALSSQDEAEVNEIAQRLIRTIDEFIQE